MKSDIVKMQTNFGRRLSSLHIWIKPWACSKIRSILQMSMASGQWLDVSSTDVAMQRITILSRQKTEESKQALLRMYGDIIEEKEFCELMAKDRVVSASSPGIDTFGSTSTTNPPKVGFTLKVFGQLGRKA